MSYRLGLATKPEFDRGTGTPIFWGSASVATAMSVAFFIHGLDQAFCILRSHEAGLAVLPLPIHQTAVSLRRLPPLAAFVPGGATQQQARPELDRSINTVPMPARRSRATVGRELSKPRSCFLPVDRCRRGAYQLLNSPPKTEKVMIAREKSKTGLLLYSALLWPIILAYLCLSIALLYRYQTWPSAVPSADALAYIEKGLAFRRIGLLADLGYVRTYGYPLIIHLYSFISGFDPLSVALVAGAVQLTLYGIATLWLASRVSTYSVTLGNAVIVGLLLNPILISLVADVLTEGVSLIIVVLALTLLLNSVQASTTARTLIWAALGAGITNFALMVRPANLFILIAWNLGFFLSLLIQRKCVNRTLILCGYVAAFLCSAAAAWSPQYLYNLSINSGGILPITPILAIQLRVGVILLKYSSIVLNNEYAEGLLFPNPWCIDPVPAASTWLWYFEHPFRGVATIAGHLFSAFNFEYPFVYVYDLDPIYSLPVAWAMWFVTTIGLLNGGRLAYLSSRTFSREHIPMFAMIGSLLLLVTGLNAFIAVENRFNMIPVAILSVLAAEFVLSYSHAARAFTVAVLILALCVSTFAAVLSEKARASAIRPTEPADTFRCLPESQAVQEHAFPFAGRDDRPPLSRQGPR